MNLAQIANAPTTSDRRVRSFSAIPSPHDVLTEFPLGSAAPSGWPATATRSPTSWPVGTTGCWWSSVRCSVHDPAAALEYASRLVKVADELRGSAQDRDAGVLREAAHHHRLEGLINDPGMDGTYDVARGLRVARQLLLDIIDIGLPVAV